MPVYERDDGWKILTRERAPKKWYFRLFPPGNAREIPGEVPHLSQPACLRAAERVMAGEKASWGEED